MKAQDSIFRAAVGVIALAAIALVFVPVAGAQVMGEYGAVVGNSAGATAAAPHADVPALPTSAARTDSSGGSTTEIKEDDSTAQDSQADDTSVGKSGDDWTEVKGSGDDGQ